MKEIAGTVFGQNALVAGLICHFAAILSGTTSAAGNDFFFRAVYPVSCLLFAAGAYAEIKAAGHPPFKGWKWYAASVVTVLPVIGPLIALSIIYSMQPGRKFSGLPFAILKLRANLLMIFILMLLLFLLFAFLNLQRDPYFKRHSERKVSSHPSFNAGWGGMSKSF